MRRTPPTEGPHARTVPTAAGKWSFFWCEMLRWEAAIVLKVHGYKSQPISGLCIMYLNCQEREGVYRRAETPEPPLIPT